MSGDLKRPEGVPDDWVCAPCSNCNRPTWYPPGAEIEAKTRGTHFAVVCGEQCMHSAIQKMRGKFQ